jgi:transcriptional regulator with XRE-family HTH domain
MTKYFTVSETNPEYLVIDRSTEQLATLPLAAHAAAGIPVGGALVRHGDDEGEPTYGQRVRAARKDQGLSLTGFAATLGIHKSYLCDIELGRRTPGPRVAGPIWMHLGVRFETAREADLRLAVEQLLDAADRMRLGVTVPAEDWYALRDYANMLLHGD